MLIVLVYPKVYMSEALLGNNFGKEVAGVNITEKVSWQVIGRIYPGYIYVGMYVHI